MRKPRGKAIKETELMKALENDPAAVMMALQGEIDVSFDKHAPREFEGLLEAESEEN